MATARDVRSIVERQATFWDLQRRMAAEGGEPAGVTLAHLAEGPWITVSRQIASGGLELGSRLASELSWQLFDHEILAEIARHTHTREEVLARIDERAISSFAEYISQFVIPGALTQIGYLQELLRVIWGLGKQGGAVILGRGANWILTPRFGLRLRVMAPRDLRVEHLAAQGGLDAAEAERRVEANDAAQAAFIRQVYGRDIDDPLGYDLVLNLGGIDTESAARLCLSALRCKLGAVAAR